MLRLTYGRELVSWAFLPLMLGAIEGGTIAIVVKKAFSGQPGVDPLWLDLATAWVGAAPNVANLTSFVWAALAKGRPKVQFISWLQIAACLLVAAIALFPRDGLGLMLVCVALGLARTAWTGVITVRAAVWRNNYPTANRAKIAGKLATIQSVTLALSGLGVGLAMDASPDNYHYLFPLLALFGLFGNQIYRKVRLRRARQLQRAELDGRKKDSGYSPMGIVALLREDRLYASFMWWMSVFGFGNLMLMAPMTYVVADELKMGYTAGILINTIIPLAVMPLAIPLWARLMDRTHIIEFRSIHGWSFVSASLAITVASWLASPTWMFVGAALLGIGFAGGTLAWNLGHQDFAPAERDAEYLAVHVSLNGIRGILAPIASWWLYQALAPRGYSPIVLLICTAVNAIGVLGFMSLRARIRPKPDDLAAAA
ncbi:MAG: MFS transporter [Phycisphaerales bacterium]